MIEGRRQASIEAQLLAQMEGTALAHLKAKLAAAKGNAKRTTFMGWMVMTKERKAENRLEKAMLTQMEGKAVSFLKMRLARHASGMKRGSFEGWKQLAMEVFHQG